MIELVQRVMSSAQFEVFLVYFVAGLGIFVRNVIYQTHLVGKHKSRSWMFMFEFCCLVVPMVLVESIYAGHVFKAIAPLIFLIVLFMFWTLKILCETSTSTSASLLIAPPSNVDATEALYNSIASFKAMVLITTTIAILAVDFPIFPSRFAKTEFYGHSLMDSGTAAFIFVSALSDYTAILRAGGDVNNRSKSAYISILSVRIPSIFVLLLLGVGRTIFVKFLHIKIQLLSMVCTGTFCHPVLLEGKKL